jgi:hypothetical protein
VAGGDSSRFTANGKYEDFPLFIILIFYSITMISRGIVDQMIL